MLNRTILTVLATLGLVGQVAVASTASAQALPPEIAKSKVVRVALEAAYPPLEVRNTAGEFEGFDIDLAAAMAKVLGVKIEYQDGAFEQMTPSLQSGRVDMIMSGFYDTPKRRAMFDFIDYLKAGAQFYSLAENKEVQKLEDLCGKTVSSVRGTSYPDTIKAFSDKICAGKEPITVILDTNLGQQITNLKTGRIVAGVQGLEAVPTIVQTEPGTFMVLGEPISLALMGMAFNKGENDVVLRDAFVYALKQVIADGTYDQLIKKWKLDISTYKDVTVNAGPQP
ncbi:ABC transporter substrate-binding protein [Ancylobacter defluvii]|uniref:ABC transporter substrate-binding protein n=1 Tax=Ancylobacter defluvii TaxID=1282440 RepID=A0A9W6JTZ9_9HYPH|nr:ABC transporter substrate-binding protein [Ancylobacter defluvii]MBS7590034.1 ABC transporter substrate-binding protein [Ancylobacter defluvii]GLK83162.1 ABC transporter substrate-binding protein [Ancylobacter defluvii]